MPQLYIDYKLYGGVEMVEAMDSTGDLEDLIGSKDKVKRTVANFKLK